MSIVKSNCGSETSFAVQYYHSSEHPYPGPVPWQPYLAVPDGNQPEKSILWPYPKSWQISDNPNDDIKPSAILHNYLKPGL